MSEVMLTLTREQIEERLSDAKDRLERLLDHDDYRNLRPQITEAEQQVALCTMALSSIAMREALKPFAAAWGTMPKDAHPNEYCRFFNYPVCIYIAVT